MNLDDCPGACARRILEIDWAETPLGPRGDWPIELKKLLFVALRSSAPKLMFWGEAQTTFYNDALMQTLCIGTGRIGLSFSDFHEEAWDSARDDIAMVMKGTPLLKSEVGQWCGGQPACDSVPWLELCYTPVPGINGRPNGVLIDVRDLSLQRRREVLLEAENARLQRLFDDAQFLITSATGPDLVIEYVNKACRKIFPGQPLVGQTIESVVPELVTLGHIEDMKNVFRLGKPWVCADVRIESRDPALGEGQAHFLDFNCLPLRNEQGTIVGIMGSGYDVTERRRTMTEAERLRHQLLHNSRINAMGTMAMTLAHELNQPLAATANLIEAARLMVSTRVQDAMGALERAQEEIQRAGNLIRRMRSLVRHGPSESPSVSIEQAFQRTVDLLEASAAHGVTLSLALAPDATDVMADGIQLEQILTNLFRNSIRAMAGSPRKEIVLSSERTIAGAVRMMVRDYGPGFSADRLENAFDYNGLGGDDGLGIGLPLTRTLVEANGGEIEARNARDGGAITIITLHGAAAL